MAAKILKCGESRVWLDPTRVADIEEAITSEDIRHLIKDGMVARKPKKGLSSFRKNKIAAQKKKGRRHSRGSVKGKTANQKKQTWMKTVRSIRRLLKELKSGGRIDNNTYRDIYTKSKSGYFRSKAHVMNYLERNNLLQTAEGGKTKK